MKPKSHKLLPIAFVTLMIVAITGNACAQRRGKMRKINTTEKKDAATQQSKINKNVSITGFVNPDQWEGDARAGVTFNNFPTSLEEWKDMRASLGNEPQGAVALQVMAFELYRNNRADGEEALKLNNTSTNYNSTVERLKEIMGKDKYYARPYIAWAMLRGATPENGYTVRPPYIIDMKVDPNKKYQESQILHGTVIYLLIDSKGWDTNWRGVEVVKPQGSDYYVVSNCPAMYTQCKASKK